MEWYFVRVFLQIEKGSGPMDVLLTKQRKKGLTPLKLFLLTVVMIIFNGILQSLPDFSMKMPLIYLLGVMIFGSIILAVVTLKKAGSSYEGFVASLTNEPTASEEKVVLYKTTDEGIYINYFNQTESEQMLFFRWKDVEEMTIGDMTYMYTESDGHSMKAERFKMNIRKKFTQAEKQLGYFPYEPKLSYSDVKAVFLKMSNHRYSQLPIPPSWHQNGNYERFIEVLNYHIDI